MFFCTDFQKLGVFCDQQDESYHLRTKTDHFGDFYFLYSVILTEYVAIETEGVCMSVCVCVCVSVCLCVEALQPKRLCRF